MPYQWVDPDLGDYTDAELVDELKDRDFNFYELLADEDGADYDSVVDQLEKLAECKRYNPDKFDEMFSQYIWDIIGKNV